MPICPQCQSPRTVTRDLAQATGGAIGTLAGAASGVAGVLRGAQLGLSVRTLIGPAGTVLGSIAGATLGGLIGGTVGCEIGATLGSAIDKTILDNHQCLDCGYTFSLPGTEQPHSHESAYSYPRQPYSPHEDED